VSNEFANRTEFADETGNPSKKYAVAHVIEQVVPASARVERRERLDQLLDQFLSVIDFS